MMASALLAKLASGLLMMAVVVYLTAQQSLLIAKHALNTLNVLVVRINTI